MLISDYIQWDLDNKEMNEITVPFINYAKMKKNTLNQARLDRYSQIIKAKFNNEENVEKYLNLINSILDNKNFQSAVSTAVNKISFPSYTNMQLKYISQIQEVLKTNIKEYQKLTNEIQSTLMGIISSFGVQGLDLDKIIGEHSNNILKQVFGESFNSEAKIVNHKEYLKLDKTALGQYKYLLSLLPDFQDILISPGNDANNSIKILSRMLVPIQTLIGFSSEFQINYEVEKILQNLEKDINSKGLQVTRVGGEGSETGGYKIGTSDLSLTLGENANLNFNLPNLGISLKRSSKNLNRAKNVNIKLKGSTYGKLLKDVDPNLLTAFYTIYSYTNPHNNGDIPTSVLNGAYKLMKMEASISALIGNIDVEDLVFVLIVNNKSITIFDLLQSMTSSSLDPFTLSPAFKSSRPGLIKYHKGIYQKQKEDANQRSDKLRSHIINKMSASVGLKLTQSQLLKFK